MIQKARGREFWDELVAEAERGGGPYGPIAARHGVTVAALKYHVYQRRKGKAVARVTPQLLRVRVRDTSPPQFEVDLGSVRLRFAEGSSPEYVGLLVAKLRQSC